MLFLFKKTITLLCMFVLACLPLTSLAQIDPSLYDESGFLLGQELDTTDLEISDNVQEGILGEAIEIPTLDEAGVIEGEIVSCFDYYTFGSIKVDVSTNFSSYESGDPVILRGQIVNENRFPITGLDIRARLVKDIPEGDYSRSMIMTLDEFDVAQDITIDAYGSVDLSYNYLLPLNAPSGDYQLLFFAYNHDRFNQAGLSFTNDITATKLAFDVTGTRPDHVYLDQTNITVGGQEHNVMAFMTQHEQGVDVPITLPLYNPYDTERIMNVTYDLYAWDSANPKNKIRSKTEQVTVPAQGETILEYVVTQTSEPVYYVVITAVPADSDKDESVSREKSMANIRFVVDGFDHPRINSVGIDSYPLVAGQEARLFTCFHNGSDQIDQSGVTVETVILDQEGGVLARNEYQGAIVPDISAIATSFVPHADVTQLTIVSRLIAADGTEIDKVEVVYDCAQINESYCIEESDFGWLGIVAGILIIGGLVFLLRRKFEALNKLRV